MPTVFISYRREDAADAAGRIYDRFASAFGENSVFLDLDSIPYAELPPDMRPLSFRNAIAVHAGPDFRPQVERLIRSISDRDDISNIQAGEPLEDEKRSPELDIADARRTGSHDSPTARLVAKGKHEATFTVETTEVHSIVYRLKEGVLSTATITVDDQVVAQERLPFVGEFVTGRSIMIFQFGHLNHRGEIMAHHSRFNARITGVSLKIDGHVVYGNPNW